MPGVKKKRPYRRSTPVGRLRRNAEKSIQHARLLCSRLSSWGGRDARVVSASNYVAVVIDQLTSADELLAQLEESGFVPPDKPRAVSWQPGQRVSVARKFRGKYEAAFKTSIESQPGYLDDLVVDSVLPSGEVSVRRPRGTSCFIVPKTHLHLRVVEREDGV